MSRSVLSTSARALSFAVLLASGAALAQTPSDIARSLWSQGHPAFATTAAPASYSAASGFTALDLARLSAPQGTAFSTSAVTKDLSLVRSAGGAADLARLSAVSQHSVPVLNRGIKIAATTHN